MNAFVGISIAMMVRDVTFTTLVAGCVGGGVLGLVTGALGHLLITVIRRRE